MSETYIETGCSKNPSNGNLDSKEKIHDKVQQKEGVNDLVFKFLDDTTIHGVRFLGKKDSTTCTRLLWLCLWLACFGIMTFQIVDRIIYFYKWPLTVDVRINYDKSLTFPAITICNQNAFKTSASAINRQYDLLEDMFFGNVSGLNTYPEWRNITLQQIYMDNGHRKEDMIVKCKWAGQKCKKEWFATTITDHGYCFTFNGPKVKDVVTASATGAGAGLKLLLNTEQYEYMPGPHDAAGFKILLHDPKEFPFVGELGKALQIGTHTFLGVELFKLHNYRSSHGNCGDAKLKYLDDYAYTVSACRSECRAEILLEKCGCLDFYYPLKKGYRSCTIEDFPCIFRTNDALRAESDSKCNCPVLCDSNHFESEISFGSISNFALEKLMKDTDVIKIKTQFFRAREISQRVWKHAAKNFEEIINRLFGRFWTYYNTVYDTLKREGNESFSSLEDVYRITRLHGRKEREFYKLQERVLRKYLLHGRDLYHEIYFIHVAANPYGLTSYIKDVFSSFFNISKNRTLASVDRKSIVNIRAVLQSKLHVAKKGYTYTKKLIDSFQNGAPIKNYKFKSYPRVDRISIVPKTLMKNALRKDRGLTSAKSLKTIIIILQKYLNYTENISKGRQINISYIEELNENFTKNCRKFSRLKDVFYTETINWAYEIQHKRLSLFEKKMDKLETNYNEMKVNFDSYFTSLDRVTKALPFILDSINLAQKYGTSHILNSSISKMDLYNRFLSPENTEVPGIIRQLTSETNARSTRNVDLSKTMAKTIKQIWKIIIHDDDIKDFYNFSNKYLGKFLPLKTKIDYWLQKSHFGSFVRGKDDDFLNAYEETINHLVDFANSLKIDETFIRNNFVNLEVFYKELSFEEMWQQPAYDIFALLCDIGGSMGLFVGASVISVFELIDLLWHIILKRRILSGWRGRSQ